jgi:hypothetical protein
MRRLFAMVLTSLLLFFRGVRLSTVVYLALKLTWALVHWFVTFLNLVSSYFLSNRVMWRRTQFR